MTQPPTDPPDFESPWDIELDKAWDAMLDRMIEQTYHDLQHQMEEGD